MVYASCLRSDKWCKTLSTITQPIDLGSSSLRELMWLFCTQTPLEHATRLMRFKRPSILHHHGIMFSRWQKLTQRPLIVYHGWGLWAEQHHNHQGHASVNRLIFLLFSKYVQSLTLFCMTIILKILHLTGIFIVIQICKTCKSFQGQTEVAILEYWDKLVMRGSAQIETACWCQAETDCLVMWCIHLQANSSCTEKYWKPTHMPSEHAI